MDLCQLKFITVGVYYFTKWIEVEAIAKITTQRVFHLYCKNIMCSFGLPGPTISKNGTQLACAMVTNFYRDLGVQIKFVFVIHLQASG